jgi:hypothetical protein
MHIAAPDAPPMRERSIGEARIHIICKHFPAALVDVLAQFMQLHFAALIGGADPTYTPPIMITNSALIHGAKPGSKPLNND